MATPADFGRLVTGLRANTPAGQFGNFAAQANNNPAFQNLVNTGQGNINSLQQQQNFQNLPQNAQNFFGGILRNTAQQGGAQFQTDLDAGKFGNPAANQFINQGLFKNNQRVDPNTGQVVGFNPNEQRNADFLRVSQTQGFRDLTGNLALEAATAGGPEFEAAIASGRFNDPFNVEINQGLATRGLQLVNGQIVPLTGVGGSEFEADQTTGETGDILSTTQAQADAPIVDATASALETIGTGTGNFQPFIDAGQQGGQEQAALSGALGAEAQADAFGRFQDSPEQQFLQEQGRRQILASAAATGGLGSGEVQRELTRFGTGLAAQDFQNRFNRLSQVAGQGIQSAAGAGTLLGQGAGIQARSGQDLSRNALTTGLTQANFVNQAGLFNAQNRFNTGAALGGAIGTTATNQADLINQQGAGTADIIGAAGGNFANIVNQLAQQTGQSQENLALILGNLTTGQAAQIAALPGIGSLVPPPNTLATISQIIGGVGTAISAFNT